MTTVNDVLDWVKEQGDVEAVDRLRMMILPHGLKEDPPVILRALQPNTRGSAAFMEILMNAAEEIIGTPVPLTLGK